METASKGIRGLRWWIVALVCIGTIMNYLTRNSLGVLAPELKGELNMSTQQYSYVVGAFQVGYTIMQPVCGIIVDLIILTAFSSGIYWRSRASRVNAGNVNSEWRGTVAPPRQAEVEA